MISLIQYKETVMKHIQVELHGDYSQGQVDFDDMFYHVIKDIYSYAVDDDLIKSLDDIIDFKKLAKCSKKELYDLGGYDTFDFEFLIDNIRNEDFDYMYSQLSELGLLKDCYEYVLKGYCQGDQITLISHNSDLDKECLEAIAFDAPISAAVTIVDDNEDVIDELDYYIDLGYNNTQSYKDNAFKVLWSETKSFLKEHFADMADDDLKSLLQEQFKEAEENVSYDY